MSVNTFKKCVYTVLVILILVFFTKDINFFGDRFYHNVKLITNPNDVLVLVNKNNRLPSNYIPDNLQMINVMYANENKYLRKEACIAFEKLSKDASILGYKVIAVSAYRDYNYQKQLYNKYVEEQGKKKADTFSARPGHSEHQTGLTIDVMGSNEDYDLFEKSPEFEWMQKNAHKYGFILRYPHNKEKITGFKYEPWHYRYVGEKVAKIIYDEQITLEEYYDKYITKESE